MKQFTSPTQKKGELGEKIALNYLIKIGFTIIETNYTKRMGEIDIVAMKNGIFHFVEVKTIYYDYTWNVSHETGRGRPYDAWQNVSREKMRRFGRTCELYVLDRNVSRETPWNIDVITVTIVRETKHAKVAVLWNVIP